VSRAGAAVIIFPAGGMTMSKRLALVAVTGTAFVLGGMGLGALTARADSPATDATKPVAKKLKVGDPSPVWKDLTGTDDKKHSLKDLADAKAVIVVFTCNHCPVAQAYEDRLVALEKDYHDKGVELVAINVNNMEADKLPAMKERAEEKGFKFAYLYDPSQAIGRAFGATVTPHAFVLDGKHRVAYMGAIDDSQQPSEVKEHYVRDAVDAILAGRAPEVATSKQFGCGIKYE
jgi:peroxiredoxin